MKIYLKSRGKQQTSGLQDFKRLQKTSWDFGIETSNFQKTSKDFQRLSKTSNDFKRLQETSGDFI
jgi:hypothetical protein